ncbi:hypothetical protein [Roseospira navarrensis]|uniref:Uncharacterized protein n=1 Tax=Roseospira navarrensis TaxID=140058 RepID=A0A7X1ZBH7_9PROT|nr:hypothetical protein [Roseospira navarrensis]MQX35473.1 hypothetical protein [Roseospira navarrensis]
MTAHIQIGDTRPRVEYVGNGVQTQFPYPFPVFTADDLQVYRDGAQVTAGFAVSGAGLSEGGTVTFTTAPAEGARIVLIRHLDIRRVTDFQAGGPLRAETLNDELDHLTAVDQQLDDALRRAVRLDPGAAEAVSLILPPPQGGAVLGWSQDGTALVNDPLNAADLVVAEANAAVLRAERWADDAALSAWRATLGGASGGGGGEIGPGDSLVVASVTTSGNVSVGGGLTVAGQTMTAWGRAVAAAVDAAAGRSLLGLGSVATTAATEYATAAQGVRADSALQPGDVGSLAAQDAGSVAISGGTIAGTTVNGLSLPSTPGSDGDVLTADGLGGVAWEAPPAGGGTVQAADITDSTATGRSVLTGDAAAGRTALGLGTAATTDATAYEAAGAVTSHETTYDHGHLPSAAEIAAIQGANAPDAGNVFATMADVGAAGGGTVTSVSVSGSDGLQVDSGSPVTTSGTIALGIDAAALRAHLGIEAGATADQTAQEIAAAIDADATAEATLKTALGLGSAAYTLSTAYATAAQGALADSAVQAADLAIVATSGAYPDLTGRPTLGTAAAADTGDFATAAQGVLAESALQPGEVGSLAAQDAGSVAITGGTIAGTTVNGLTLPSTAGTGGDVLTADGLGGVTWAAPVSGGAIVSTDITDSTATGRSILTGDAAAGLTALGLGAAALSDPGDFATALQGQTAETAIQPGDNAALALIDYTLARFAVTAANVDAAHTVALSDGEWQALTLTADPALTLPDPPAGRGYSITLRLIQDATGGRAPTLQQADATPVKWVGGTVPTWQTAAGAGDLVAVTHDGVDLIATHIGSVS